MADNALKPTVAVFFGGRSVEHEVSIITGLQAYAALNRSKYNALPVYIAKDGLLYTGAHMDDIDSYKDMKACLDAATRVVPVQKEGGRAELVRWPVKKFGGNVVATFDAALPAVHGTNSEDGTLMGLLESLGVPYTGCDILSSALGMDKYAMKAVLKQAGLPVLDARVFTTRRYALEQDAILDELEADPGFPVIVKPVNLGSSVGITRAADRGELAAAMDTAFAFAPRVLIERAVANLREINCAVLGDADEAASSVCEEPLAAGDILDYNKKYINDAGKTGGADSGMAALKRRLPADIPGELAQRVQSLSVETFRALGCAGVARVDFLNDRETGELFVNEINTIPGSLAFYLWEASGVSFPELLDKMLSVAFKRQRERQALTYTYESNILSGVSLGGLKGAKGGKA